MDKEKLVRKKLNYFLDTPYCEGNLIEIFLMFEDAKQIKLDDGENFMLSYENDDGIIGEVDMQEMVEKIMKYSFEMCEDDFNLIFNLINKKYEKSKN